MTSKFDSLDCSGHRKHSRWRQLVLFRFLFLAFCRTTPIRLCSHERVFSRRNTSSLNLRPSSTAQPFQAEWSTCEVRSHMKVGVGYSTSTLIKISSPNRPPGQEQLISNTEHTIISDRTETCLKTFNNNIELWSLKRTTSKRVPAEVRSYEVQIPFHST